jgi:uncharacterized protein (TIGR02118 family)
MAYVVAIYKTPADPAAFDAYYAQKHAPLAKTLPGLRAYKVSRGPIVSPTGTEGIYKVAVLEFDDLAAVQAALGSPEGAATAGDLGNFAQAGVDLLIFDSIDA